MIGRLVGHYRILEKIGSGGMGDVFRARDERLGRDVAVKLIRETSHNNPDHLRRFELEARAAAALSHPNILAIYDVGLDGAVPYIVSELLSGQDLRKRLTDSPVSIGDATDYALQIAQGLTAAHEHLIIHRDLKPENLFLTHDGRIKILDFGVAKLQAPAGDQRPIENLTTVTKHGSMIGTVAYMSPEQLRGKPVDHRSDLFSLGAILYEMLTGCRAFRGETEVDTISAVLLQEPPNKNLEQSDIPRGYRDVVGHCLEKEPENRFQSAKDLVFALRTLSSASAIAAAPPVVPILEREPRPRRALAWILGTALVAAIGLLAIREVFPPVPPTPSYRRVTSEAGTVYAARFSGDGRSIVYGAAWNGKPVEIFSTVGSSLLAQPLNMSKANLLALSPSNELALVLGGTHNGELETVNGMLARAPLAGGSPREILPEVRWADWDERGELAVVNDADNHSRLEFPIGHVLYESAGWISNIRFSPRGDQIAFMDHRVLWDDMGTVSVVDFSGHVRTLTPEWHSESGLAWRRDGKEIWFSAVENGTNLNLMATDLSGKVRTVLDLPLAVTLQDIAPDGRVLVALNTKRMVMAFATLGSKEEVDLSWHDWNSARDISSEGQSVLFEDASELAGSGYSVAVRRVDGALPVTLGDGSPGGLSPDGKWAVAVSTRAPELILLPTRTGQPRTLPVPGLTHLHTGYARFLPNGKEVAVNGSKSTPAARCYVVDLSTGKAKPITPDGILCGPLSPEGRSLVGKGAAGSIAIYPIDGGEPRPVPHLDSTFVPVQWSTDASMLYGYHTGELPSRIYKMKIATGEETVLHELRPAVPTGVVMVAPVVVNRDGTRFAYSYSQCLSVLYIVSGLH